MPGTLNIQPDVGARTAAKKSDPEERSVHITGFAVETE